jgi:outer membrane protein TolC
MLTISRWPRPALSALLLLALAARPAAAQGLSISDAIRAAWATHPGLHAGEAEVESLRAQAAAAGDARFPTLSLGARALRTTEPVAAFGLKLDQGRIAQSDFNPALLNSPDAAYSWGLSASITQPLYAGGRIDAGRRATAAMAEAAGLTQERRKEELAAGVLEAYFGSQVAEQGVRFAEDLLAQARETEAFTRARAEQGAMLDADAARARAFRAQAEAELASANQRLATSRSALAMLVGDAAETASLTTALGQWPVSPNQAAGTVRVAEYGEFPETPAASSSGGRADLLAARARVRAAGEGVAIAQAGLLPEVFVQLSAETARRNPNEGTVWTTAVLGARWQLSLGSLDEAHAASARARAAEESARWDERRALREVEEARRAIGASASRVAAAREAVSASVSSREQRTARHRQGLLPLTDVLDAETALSGARALLLRSQLESRLAVAQLQLASGTPIEGVTP